MTSPFDSPQAKPMGQPAQPKQQATMPFDSAQAGDKELRIVKQAIAKSFIEAGHAKFTPQVEAEIEKWIKWVFRYEDKDKNLTK